MKAYIFPGQGSQFKGMGKKLYEHHPSVREYFDQANDVLGFDLKHTMMEGSENDLKQTRVTQPAVYVFSYAAVMTLGRDVKPDAVAGHSLGEFTALSVADVFSFKDGLELVRERALAMQEACEQQESTMAAILGLDDETVENICASMDEVVVPANYNCPGQLVISGSKKGIQQAVDALKEAGAKRAIVLKVGGAFHSPLMTMARERLRKAIEKTEFSTPVCPVYQNVTGRPSTDPGTIQDNLVDQLTSPVRWTQTIRHMIDDGVSEFIEAGGKVLSSMVRKINRSVEVQKVGI